MMRIFYLLSSIATIVLICSSKHNSAAFIVNKSLTNQRTNSVWTSTIEEESSKTILPWQKRLSLSSPSTSSLETIKTNNAVDISTLCDNFENSLNGCKNDVTKTCKVKVSPTSRNRIGLVATSNIKKGDVILSMPYDDSYIFTSDLARSTTYDGILPDNFDSWTGDSGLIALLLLNELALIGGKGIKYKGRTNPDIQMFLKDWILSLPSYDEVKTDKLHPLLWNEDEQEILQSCSTKKIYRILDDIDEDYNWLDEKIFSNDRTTKFPETVSIEGKEIPCFTVEGFKWAMSIVQSRSVYVDGMIRLIPLIDFANHDNKALEVQGGTMGTFGTTKGAQIVSSMDYNVGDEIYVSYGPKSPADYVLEHGFVSPETFKTTSVAEITFELSEDDKFYDDKLDILEYETYDLAPMDPIQSFDVVADMTYTSIGTSGEPDPALIQFVRLLQVGGKDAFLLESIFRKEVWDFMSLPVSEQNELDVMDTITDVCTKELNDLIKPSSSSSATEDDASSSSGSNIVDMCTKLYECETRALERTIEYVNREKEALDLKEYYQERRLKDLGLDSEWTPEDDIGGGFGDENDGPAFGQTRLPGGADYDW